MEISPTKILDSEVVDKKRSIWHCTEKDKFYSILNGQFFVVFLGTQKYRCGFRQELNTKLPFGDNLKQKLVGSLKQRVSEVRKFQRQFICL